MKKTDFKKQFSNLYSAKTGLPVTVIVPPLNYLMVDGTGDPNTSPAYVAAIQTLYTLAYTLKFMCKQEREEDYSVMPLEGLWWTKDIQNFAKLPKSNWHWAAMIMQPNLITNDMVERAAEQLVDKGKLPALNTVRFETYTENRAAQVLYIGPYSDEAETIQSLHAFIHSAGGELTKTSLHHHEIYLSDPRRTAAAKLKTIIRQPY